MARPRRAGRKRVYCTNSCRQYAYRWRRDHLGLDRDERPVERAITRDRLHAVRRSDDPAGAAIDGDRRRITACGTMARLASDEPSIHGHLRLLPDPPATTGVTLERPVPRSDPPRGAQRACRRCVELRALPVYELDEGLAQAATFRAEHDGERRRSLERRRARQHRARARAAAA